MPRQIIDTESSRPAYVRRVAIRWTILGIGLVLLALGAWLAWGHHLTPARP